MAGTTTVGSDTGGHVLTVADIDQLATHIAEMWDKFNTDRRIALKLGEEARRYVHATDIDSTSAVELPHKNRTHQPKLTEISDVLQSQYYEAALSMPKFFRFNGETDQDKANASNIEAWIRTKLEQKKFRETVGRQLINDYVTYGNPFASTDYVIEKDQDGAITYRGPLVKRISPIDILFNPRGESFQKVPKLQRTLIHVAELAEMPSKFPNAGFDIAAIDKVKAVRHHELVNDWVELIKERGLAMDGFGSVDDYYKQDMAEILIYRGDVFNRETGESQRRRVVYIADRTFVIRNDELTSPAGFDGLHSTGWRIRPDNLWAQGPLDNLVGMQYRIDHLENLKADIFDLIAQPVLLIKGEEVEEPQEGYAPGAVYYAGVDADVSFLVPDTTALNADNQIALYHRYMEQFAGVMPQTRGIRTPGEKTAFEVDRLDQGATMPFLDKVRNFERMLETMLKEIFELMLINYDGSDYVEIFNDITGEAELRQLSEKDVNARGTFTAIGARHWQRRTRLVTEMNTFMQGPMQDPKIRMHTSGERLAKIFEQHMDFNDDQLIEPFAGVKEDVHAQAIAQAEAQQFEDEDTGGGVRVGDASGTGTEVLPGQEPAEKSNIPT